MRESLLQRRLLFVFLAAMLTACGGGSQHTQQEHAGVFPVGPTPDYSLEDDGIDYPHLRATPDGRVIVDDATPELRQALYFELVPAAWPEDRERPRVGVGYLHQRGDETLAVEVAVRQVERLDALEVRPADALLPLTSTKLLASVTALEGRTIELNVGEAHGVAAGDIYFLLNEAPLDGRAPRLGDRISAVVRVGEDVGEERASAELVHRSSELNVGMHAVFMQALPLRPEQPVSIVAAPLRDGDEAAADGDLPLLLQALPELLAEYGLSLIEVRTLDTFIDPRPVDAPEQAQDLAPEGTFGSLVFGDIEDSTLIYNATVFGDAPSPDNSVGILPGGLPLPFRRSPAELSEQLAVAYVAGALGLRGEHALAIYIMETELRDGEFNSDVRYHLREHLALRYASLSRGSEALRLMNFDVAESREQEQVYPLLNALSIRAYLDRSFGLPEQWLDDAGLFLRIARQVLPDDRLGYEELQYALALRANGDLEGADELLQETIVRGQEQDDLRLQYLATMYLALNQVARDQPEAALLVLSELEAMVPELELEQRVYTHLVGAEIRARVGMQREALSSLGEAFAAFEDVAPNARADMLERAAGIMRAVEQPIEAARAVRDAARIREDLGQLDEAATLYSSLGQMKFQLVEQFGQQGGFQLAIEARGDMLRAARYYERLGKSADAAMVYGFVGVIDSIMRNTASADIYLQRGIDAAILGGNYRVIVELLEIRAQAAARLGDFASALSYREQAERWAELGDVPFEFDEMAPPAN